MQTQTPFSTSPETLQACRSPLNRHRRALVFSLMLSVGVFSEQARAETSLAYWNLNSYNPGNQTTSLADTGSQAGTAVLDWSHFGVANVRNPAPDFSATTGSYLSTLPSGETAGTGLGLTSPIGNKHLDFRFDATGVDYLTVRGYNTGSFYGLPGAWSYSLNGTTFAPATAVSSPGGTVKFLNSEIANQSNVTLRLSQQPTYSNFYNYDNLSLAGSGYNGLAITGQIDQRIVKGASLALNYTLSERSGAAQNYTLAITGLSNVQDLVNGANPNPSISSRSSNPISGIVETATANAGDTIAATVTANSTTSGVAPVSKTTNVQVLDNRTLALQGSGNLGNLGRVVVGSPLATVTLATNGQTDSEATRITLNSGTFDRSGLTFTVAANQVFNSANETATVVVSAVNFLGNRTFSANLKDARSSYSNDPILTAENIPGSNLSNVNAMLISGSATVIANRDLTTTSINLGREMVGSGTQNVNGSTTVTVSGGSLSDTQGTGVTLNETVAPIMGNGITATIAGTTTFNGANQTAAVQVNYTGVFDRSSAGRQAASLNLAGQLSNGEAPSVAGVVLDDSVPVTLEKTFVQNRLIYASSSQVVVGALAGTTIESVSNSISTNGSDNTNTRITVNGQLFNGNYPFFVDDTVAINQTSAVSTLTTILGTKTVTAVGEGLAGETPSSTSWDYGTQFYQAASATVSAVVGGNSTGTLATGNTQKVLHVGDSITVASAAKSDGGNGERASTSVYTGFIGNDGFSLAGLGGSVGAGSTAAGNLSFDSTGKLNGTHTAALNLTLSNDLGLLGSSIADLGTYLFTAQHVVTGNSGNGGNAYVASGTRLKDSGIRTSFSNSVLSQATTAALKDSQTLAANVEIQLAFGSIHNATGTDASNLVSDTVSLSGLHGITFVLQIGYDEATLVNKFGTEEVAILTWLNTNTNTWVNAIEGNSNYGLSGAENAFGQRFRMSYDGYLSGRGDGLPRLNDYGYDPTANTMWAVLDHNSEFGGSGFNTIPEPSTYALLALGGAIILGAMRRRRANS